MAITMTDFAIQKLSEILSKRQTPNDYLRITDTPADFQFGTGKNFIGDG